MACRDRGLLSRLYKAAAPPQMTLNVCDLLRTDVCASAEGKSEPVCRRDSPPRAVSVRRCYIPNGRFRVEELRSDCRSGMLFFTIISYCVWQS